jgi:hypothetical protein
MVESVRNVLLSHVRRLVSVGRAPGLGSQLSLDSSRFLIHPPDIPSRQGDLTVITCPRA